jgi:predicted Zn-dependent protease
MLKKFFFTVFLFTVFIPELSRAQKELSEPDKLKFESAFFEALKQKAIGNYDKAIAALEICQSLDSTQVSVQFELSKNYFWLKQYFEAQQTLTKALKKEPKNMWLLEHAKNIAVAQGNYPKAIAYQKEIIAINPFKKTGLINLYLANHEKNKVRDLINVIEKEQGLNSSLKRLKKALLINTKPLEKPKSVSKNASLSALKKQYKTTGNFKILKQILKLEIQQKNYNGLLKDASEALDLFPSQAVLYLYAAQGSNALNKYKAAIAHLDNGIDFVIDKPTRKQYYLTYIKSYKGLNNTPKVNYYKKLVNQL